MLRTKLLYCTAQLDIPMYRGDFVARYSNSVFFIPSALFFILLRATVTRSFFRFRHMLQ
jgi:hypothetical protein